MSENQSADESPVSRVSEAAGESEVMEPEVIQPDVPAPVRPDERLAAVDVLRGFALLGILAMNIVMFAWPMGGYENPRFSGGDEPGNAVAWWINSLFFSGKMMSLFSMLFGAGLVLMTDRATARGASLLGTYYRRIFWLLVIGLIHAYFIWAGDILVFYALCGVLLYWFRRRSPRTLIILSVLLLLISSGLGFGFVQYGRFAAGVAEQVEADLAAGRKPAEWQLQVQEAWNDQLRPMMRPDDRDFGKEIRLYQSGYLTIVVGRAPEVLMFQIFGFLFFMLWGVGGRMLLGMALMKLNVFSAERSWRFYQLLALFGYGIGLPLTIYGTWALFVNNYDSLHTPSGASAFMAGMVPVSLGHAAAIMMICKANLWIWLTMRLAAVGRMALTNYLVQSLLCTTLFYGYGFGWFGRVDRVGLWVVVLAIWALQLMISPIWLSRFRYGPAEWLWRSLTYWRWQSMRQAT